MKIEFAAEGGSRRVALICVKWADRHEQIAERTPSFSLARTARRVSMTVYMSCWHNALYEGRTASCLLLCTAEVRYAQLTRTDELQTSWVLLPHHIDSLFINLMILRKCLLPPSPFPLTSQPVTPTACDDGLLLQSSCDRTDLNLKLRFSIVCFKRFNPVCVYWARAYKSQKKNHTIFHRFTWWVYLKEALDMIRWNERCF